MNRVMENAMKPDNGDNDNKVAPPIEPDPDLRSPFEEGFDDSPTPE